MGKVVVSFMDKESRRSGSGGSPFLVAPGRDSKEGRSPADHLTLPVAVLPSTKPSAQRMPFSRCV